MKDPQMFPLKIKGSEKLPINNNDKSFFKEKLKKEDFIIPTVILFFAYTIPPSVVYCIDKYNSNTTIHQSNLSKFKTPELIRKILNIKETEKEIKWLMERMKKDDIFWFIEDVDKKIRDLKRQNETIDPTILNDFNNLKMAQIKKLSIENLTTIHNKKIYILPFDSRYNPPQSTKDIKLPRKPKKQFFFFPPGINEREGKLNIFLEKWLNKKNNHDILSKLKIENINNLTPYQAIRLAIEIVQKELTYSYIQASPSAGLQPSFFGDYSLKKTSIKNLPAYIKKNPKLAYKIRNTIDKRSIAELLEKGKGICRNYTRAVENIFNLLKRSQDLKTSQLKNTYVFYAGTHFDEKNILNSIAEHHAWVDVVSILSTGDIVISNIDMVNEDAGEVYVKNSTTKGYYLFFLNNLKKEGIISKEQFERAVKNFGEKIKPNYQSY
ncbi:MAG: hypothetical protein KAI16_01815 [Candidatus Pacebacteria bacterium]|nr:hypothetical protein [Candidatus Paceibacterota bacterium]